MVQMPNVIHWVMWGGESTVLCGVPPCSACPGITEAIWPPSGILLTRSTCVPTEHLVASVGVAVQLPEQ